MAPVNALISARTAEMISNLLGVCPLPGSGFTGGSPCEEGTPGMVASTLKWFQQSIMKVQFPAHAKILVYKVS